ncbi:MAG: RtcB family protein, partial [candidate division KSB1 bacterium]|nr:RtcB family protein [candidate division KSB1 bacterium]
MKLEKISDYLWEIPRQGNMRVPARIYAAEKMLKHILADNAPQQAMNVAHLPGIVGYSLAMPDIHWGYGFPIGGVAAFDIDSGVISPGGVGYDINCGVRLMASSLTLDEVKPKIQELVKALFHHVPTGVGSEGKIG